ncbi:MAG TPA: MFS transporter [Streptosporangiaceae bacterium]|nr:MFS transporter [Streptosporangiaceae bacterium]
MRTGPGLQPVRAPLLAPGHPGPAGALIILAASGLCTCYQLAANAAFVRATPPEQRSQAFGVAQGGINLGQGLVIVLAGAAAERFTPDAVIGTVGALGTLCAVLLAVSQAARHRLATRTASEQPG